MADTLTNSAGGKYSLVSGQIKVNGALTAGTDSITIARDFGNGYVLTKSFNIVVSAAGSALYDFTGGTMPSGSSASGAANGTVRATGGSITAQAAPRFDYLTGAATLLVEPARTNALKNSDSPQVVSADAFAFGDASSSGTSTVNGINYFTMNEGTATNRHSWAANSSNRPSITASQKVAASIFLRAGTCQYIRVQCWFSTGMIAAIVDTVGWTVVSTQVLGTGSVVDSAVLVDYGNGNHRLEMVGNLTASDVATILGVYMLNNSTPALAFDAANYAGTSRTVLLGNPQIEVGVTSCSSLIKTTTAAVTRTADAVSVNVPAGVTTLRITYDNDATQDFAVTPSSTYALVPSNLNRSRIKTVGTV